MPDVRDILQDSARLRQQLILTVALAIVGDFILVSLVETQQRRVAFAIRLVTFAVVAAFWLGVGWYFGRHAWRKRGHRLARYLLRRTLTRKAPPLVFLTDRPDVQFSLARRLLEVVGFAAGTVVILVAILSLTGSGLLGLLVGSGIALLLALWGCFALVPYWVFAQMGLRHVDPVRWLVMPMSRRYAQRMRLSNGVLLLFAFGATIQLAFRAGASPTEAVLNGITLVGHTVASVLIAAAAALAFYVHDEHALVRELEREAVEMGVHDGRGMSDGEFLPRVPVAAKR